MSDFENYLEHSLQVNGFSPEWVLKWPLKLPNPENDLEHSSQVYGFSPECVLRWVLRLSDSENYLEHSLQVNGFSPEWVLVLELQDINWVEAGLPINSWENYHEIIN